MNMATSSRKPNYEKKCNTIIIKMEDSNNNQNTPDITIKMMERKNLIIILRNNSTANDTEKFKAIPKNENTIYGRNTKCNMKK